MGGGRRGIRALKILTEMNIRVEFWLDNDSSKIGTVIENLKCVDRDEICLSDYYIFVSPLNSNELYNNLKEKYERVIPTEGLKYLEILSRMFSGKEPYGYIKIHSLGHFYEPYPDLNWVIKYEKDRKCSWRDIKDINYNIEEQKNFLLSMEKCYNTAPKWQGKDKITSYRYYYENDQFEIVDALFLHCMMRILKPKRIIEVGSGYSSAVMLDTNQYYFNNEIKLSFIEPYPQRLKQLLQENDNIELYECILQDVDIKYFDKLEKGDILFIDSSHVSKRDSDVNKIFFEIFPRLKSGVYIHIHDVMKDFEYPINWLMNGNVWNEMYLLRAFLQNNNDYKIVFFEGLMLELYYDEIRKRWPYEHFVPGGSFWMKKI